MPDVPQSADDIRTALAAAAMRVEGSATRDAAQIPDHPELSDLARRLADAAKAVANAAKPPIG
jgi:hypothetical protein